MKALPLLLAGLFLNGCEFKSKTTMEVMNESESAHESATPKPKAATPPPTPRPGDWRLKPNPKNPLEQRPR